MALIAAMLLLILTLTACDAPSPASPTAPSTQSSKPTHNLSGRVVSVTDGDTVRLLLAGNQQLKIRLNHIDAPERSQAFGTRSKQNLARYVGGKDVTVRVYGTDKYGRTLGEIILGKQNVNLAMVRDGLAWHYKKYSQDKLYAKAEKDARAAKRGLWSDAQPRPPWNWRHGGQARQRPLHPGSGKYWINSGSSTRHNSGCEWFGRTKRGYYTDDADKGRACGGCGG